MSSPNILLAAGEPSGDLHGAAVAAALKRRWPDARLYGLGGPRMAAAGVELLADPRRLAVMGFVEVVAHLPFFLRLLRRVHGEMLERQTDLVLPIDYPGFNLRLSRMAREAGIPVLYYIAPQVWAWHRSRVQQLAEFTDRLAVILPFEEALFREAGARASFVGHPLLDLPAPCPSREELCRSANLHPDRPILALFPGSRAQEVARHLPVFMETARRVRARRTGLQPVIAASESIPRRTYEGLPFPRITDSRALLRHARAALVKSGTGTLEAALAGTPMVIAYRAHPLTYWLARRLVEVPSIGLVNLVAGERIAREFVQGDATPAALTDALVPLLDPEGPERREAVIALRRVRASLAAPGGAECSAADRVGGMAEELLAGTG